MDLWSSETDGHFGAKSGFGGSNLPKSLKIGRRGGAQCALKSQNKAPGAFKKGCF